jgi:hypothetical protein
MLSNPGKVPGKTGKEQICIESRSGIKVLEGSDAGGGGGRTLSYREVSTLIASSIFIFIVL